MVTRSRFIQGPAGAGKTSAAIQHIRRLLEENIRADHILVLVPQRTLGQSYHLAFAEPGWPAAAQTDIVTLGGLARRGLEIFWPLVAEKAGFAAPRQEPRFLTIETSQYYMAGLVNEAIRQGVFDSISVEPADIMRQTLDNLSKAAVNRFSLEEVANRLITAWGSRHSSRPPVYRESIRLAQAFRKLCLQRNLLDFSLQIDLFMDYLLDESLYRDYVRERYRHLVADNLEESFPVVADFIQWLWQDLESALLVYDTDAGYRIFLGADPAGMAALQDQCVTVESWDKSVIVPPYMSALSTEFNLLLREQEDNVPDYAADPRSGFVHEAHKFYPQMIDWVIEHIATLIEDGVSPREIVVLAPFLGDSLRFSLVTRLEERGIPTVSHRPSRAVRDEPAARTVLTLMMLAYPEWGRCPPFLDVSDALHQAIDELDPVRAWLLAQIVYRRGTEPTLSSFDNIRPEMQARITYLAGEKFEHVRQWLSGYHVGPDGQNDNGNIPPDHFISRLFGQVLAQPGYGFHSNLETGRVVAELVESARKFRQTLYPEGTGDWRAITRDYVELVQEGLLAALYVASWRDEQKDAVFLVPAYTFLMRNRWVDYQFWLDAGSSHWWERLEQPLTHPYVLTRNYPAERIWTDDDEIAAREDALRRLVLGLVRRCRQQVFVAISDLSEQGYEQRGPLLALIQQVVQRHLEREDIKL